jgi:hypothetical protein
MSGGRPEPAGRGPATAALLRLVGGHALSAALYVVAELKIADLLAEGPQRSADLAAATGTHGAPLERVLRALASRGVFAEDEAGRFRLTPTAELLRSDVPHSVRAVALSWGHPARREPLGLLLYSVRTGRPAFDRLYGVSLREHLARDPGAADRWGGAAGAGPRPAEVLAAHDFSALRRVVDVGGGGSRLLAAILSAHPMLRGTVVEAPEALAAAHATLRAAGVADRGTVVAGDRYAALPRGADAYLLSDVLMDWDDDGVVAVLRRCRRAMSALGQLLVIEELIPSDNAPTASQLRDLDGLAVSGARLRTEAEYQQLLAAAGFRLTATVAVPSGATILVAQPLRRPSRPRRSSSAVGEGPAPTTAVNGAAGADAFGRQRGSSSGAGGRPRGAPPGSAPAPPG